MEVAAVDEAVAVVVDPVVASLVGRLLEAADFGDALAARVASVELTVGVVVLAVGALFEGVLAILLFWSVRDELAAVPRREDAVWILAVDEPVVVVVEVVAAIEIVDLVTELGLGRGVVLARRAEEQHTNAPENELYAPTLDHALLTTDSLLTTSGTTAWAG